MVLVQLAGHLAVTFDLAEPPGALEIADVRITSCSPTTPLWNSAELSFVNYDD